jgi:hypothetical protein
MEQINKEAFVRSYLATAAWVTCETGECQDFMKEAKEVALASCEKFIELCIEKFGEEKAMALLTVPAVDLDYLAPHCLFLNRNGHGSGFWDREKEFGDDDCKILSEIAKSMGSQDCMHIRGKKSKLILE